MYINMQQGVWFHCLCAHAYIWTANIHDCMVTFEVASGHILYSNVRHLERETSSVHVSLFFIGIIVFINTLHSDSVPNNVAQYVTSII